MQISNINTVSFNANRRNSKRNEQVSERPFDIDKRADHTKRNIIAAAGVAAVGIAAGALLIHKKPDIYKRLIGKIQSINPFKKNQILQSDNSKIKRTPKVSKVDIPAKDAAPKVSLEKTPAAETVTTEVQKEKVSLTKPAVQQKAVVEEQQPKVSLKKTPAIEKTNIETPDVEKAQEVSSAAQPSMPTKDADVTAQKAQDITQKPQEIQNEQHDDIPDMRQQDKKQAKLDDIPDTRQRVRKHSKSNDIPDMRQRVRKQGKINPDSLTDRRRSSVASKTNVQQENIPVTKDMVSDATIRANQQNNFSYLSKRMHDNGEIYSDFGIDKEIQAEFLKLNPDFVKEMNNDEFISYLLAPSDKLTLSYRELNYGLPKKSAIKSIFKNSTVAKQDRAAERKFKLHSTVSDIASTQERISKLKELEKNFTVDELHKIFNSSDEYAQNRLLNWLMNFFMQGEKGSAFLESFKSIIA